MFLYHQRKNKEKYQIATLFKPIALHHIRRPICPTPPPIDYQAALDAFRRVEHTPDNPVRSPDLPASPPMTDGYVDYQAMIKAWDREQENLHRIRMKAGKRNPSHDPVYREPSSGAEK